MEYPPKIIAYSALLALTLISQPLHSAENWAGGYIGFNLAYHDYENKGYGDSFDDIDSEALYVWSQTNKRRSDAGTGGGLKAGYNWQSGKYVYGILADITYLDASIDKETPGGISDGHYSYKRTDSIKWLATLRGKAGMDVNGFLPYVTAGLAYGDIKSVHQTITCCPTLYESSRDHKETGYIVGLGVEKKINGRFSLNLEALYVDFGKENGSAHATVGSKNALPSRVKLENKMTLINLGLNYSF